tara:strand:- start:59 stop:391 length:333 start_codon:yes stop_codon:yes gene_type:complete
MPTKTKKRQYFKTNMVELSLGEDDEASDKELATAAKTLGVSVSSLKQTIAFSNHVRDEVSARDLTPPQVLSTCLGIVSEVIADCYAKDSYERICSDIYTQLRDSCGLKLN